jgi:hypothetical protein
VKPFYPVGDRRLQAPGGFSLSPYPTQPTFGINAPPLAAPPLEVAPPPPSDGTPPPDSTGDDDIFGAGMGGAFAGGAEGGGGRDWDEWIKHESREKAKDRELEREIEREKRRVERESSKRRAKVAYWGMGADILKQGLKPPPPVVVGSTKPNPELAMFRRRGGGLLSG